MQLCTMGLHARLFVEAGSRSSMQCVCIVKAPHGRGAWWLCVHTHLNNEKPLSVIFLPTVVPVGPLGNLLWGRKKSTKGWI